MGAEPEFLMYFKYRFDGFNLDEDLDQLREKGKGSPERIAAAIDEWAEHEKIHCSSPYTPPVPAWIISRVIGGSGRNFPVAGGERRKLI